MNFPPQGRPRLLAPPLLTCAPDAIPFHPHAVAESTGTHDNKGGQLFRPPLPDCACETPFPSAIMQTPRKRGSGMSGSALLFTWTYYGLHVEVPCGRAPGIILKPKKPQRNRGYVIGSLMALWRRADFRRSRSRRWAVAGLQPFGWGEGDDSGAPIPVNDVRLP
jgi:hypothetical protein